MPDKTKNPAAVELGRRGGSVKGIKKGFALLPKSRRKQIAQDAARKRWKNKEK